MTANRIIAHVFLQPSLELVNEAAMEQLVADHPYFSAARLLLAKKVYQETGNLHHPAVKKALLYSDQHHYAYQLITAEEVLQVVENRVAAIIPEDALPEVMEEPEAPIAVADFEPGNASHTATAEILPPPVVMPAATNGQDHAEAVDEEESTSSGPIKIFPMAAAEEETELIFQPLYTDDYFAYKRLKNPDEADDLNEQGAAEMKSFTSWLRQMKDNFAGKTSKDWYHQQLHRMYEEEEEPEVSETVEKMAMDSIVFNNDIVSETLAEIWVRQQQYGNAIKIYQKLSLLNPDKNAYFAQKILDLKSKTDKNKQ
ncbi:tetratricopeptide (TPR) repeat protein [Chitinophaga sp. W3I9]|uniref:hypothetical protein n=1 Tax=Chitinophaga sp. W3I9 TaxID=3373924 RepID=UPI003D251CAA